MISEITPEDTAGFVGKYQFSDGLVREVIVSLSGESTERQAKVICSVRRRVDDEWCNLILHIHGLSAFRAVHGRRRATSFFLMRSSLPGSMGESIST